MEIDARTTYLIDWTWLERLLQWRQRLLSAVRQSRSIVFVLIDGVQTSPIDIVRSYMRNGV